MSVTLLTLPTRNAGPSWKSWITGSVVKDLWCTVYISWANTIRTCVVRYKPRRIPRADELTGPVLSVFSLVSWRMGEYSLSETTRDRERSYPIQIISKTWRNCPWRRHEKKIDLEGGLVTLCQGSWSCYPVARALVFFYLVFLSVSCFDFE